VNVNTAEKICRRLVARKRYVALELRNDSLEVEDSDVIDNQPVIYGASRPAVASEPQPLLVKAPEAAKLLGIGRRKLWTMTNCGEIPYVRFGAAVRYSPTALQEWVARKTKGGK
jgi:excisionase family DNA binding protein